VRRAGCWIDNAGPVDNLSPLLVVWRIEWINEEATMLYKSYERLIKTLFIAVFLVLSVTVAGCGGGDQGGGEQPDGEEQQGQGDGAAEQKDAPEVKIALGRIATVDAEAQRFSLRPTGGEGGDDSERIIFKLAKNPKITLDGEEAEIADMEKRQQAQVEYVVRKDRNLARVIELFKEGEDEGGGE
jgi:hypothetical protein